MADDKKDGSVTLLNRGQRWFDIGVGADKKPRRHGPGTTMTYSAEEAKRVEGYKDLMDITKLPGSLDAKKLKAENNQLSDENKRLKEQLAALSAPKVEEPRKKEKAAN